MAAWKGKVMSSQTGLLKPTELQCPVCGYYCLGKGGFGCINKPKLVAETQESLGSDFESVLHKNLWGLYEEYKVL